MELDRIFVFLVNFTFIGIFIVLCSSCKWSRESLWLVMNIQFVYFYSFGLILVFNCNNQNVDMF